MAHVLERWLAETDTTKAEFARRIGKTPSLISHYTSGRRSPSEVLAGVIERVTEGAVPVSAWREQPKRPRGSQALYDWLVIMRLNRQQAARHFKVGKVTFALALDGRKGSPLLLKHLQEWGPLVFDTMSVGDFVNG